MSETEGKYVSRMERGYRYRVTNILTAPCFFINHQLDLVFVTKASKQAKQKKMRNARSKATRIAKKQQSIT